MSTILVAVGITFTRTDGVETKAHIWYLFSEKDARPKESEPGNKQAVTKGITIF